MRSFMKIKPYRNGKITLSFIDKGKPCISREFFTSLLCLLMLFAKIIFSRKFPNLQYFCPENVRCIYTSTLQAIFFTEANNMNPDQTALLIAV